MPEKVWLPLASVEEPAAGLEGDFEPDSGEVASGVCELLGGGVDGLAEDGGVEGVCDGLCVSGVLDGDCALGACCGAGGISGDGVGCVCGLCWLCGVC